MIIEKWMQAATFVTLLSAASCWTLGAVGPYNEKERGEEKGIDMKTVAKYKELGAIYHQVMKFAAFDLIRDKQLPGFEFESYPNANLPDVAVPFGLRFHKITDDQIQGLARLKNLVSLDLTRTEVTGTGLKHLSHLEKLSFLNLPGSRINDDGLKELASLKNLTAINLMEGSITDSGMKHLARVEGITQLYLTSRHFVGVQDPEADHGTKDTVTERGLNELGGLKKLNKLYIAGNFTDRVMKGLSRLETLRSLTVVAQLNVTYVGVTDLGVKALAPLKNLVSLELINAHVTDAGLRDLVAFKRLASLSIIGTAVTDAGLKELAGLKNLQQLNLKYTEVTGAGITALQKELPACEIIRGE